MYHCGVRAKHWFVGSVLFGTFLMTECECLDFFVDEACGAFLARMDRIMCIGVACLFLGGRSDMTIDVLSRCNKGKHLVWLVLVS